MLHVLNPQQIRFICMIEENNIFKLAGTTYNFKAMKYYSHSGIGQLKFDNHDQEVYRLRARSYQALSPKVTAAYLDYITDQILLGGDDD